MTFSAWLEPRVDPNETLEDGFTERPVVHIPKEAAETPFTLGRGSQTGIADRTIAERIVDLKLCHNAHGERALQATPVVGFANTKVHVNGVPLRVAPGQSAYLFSGDVLSLDNLRYEYKVHFENAATSVASAKAPSARGSDLIFPPKQATRARAGEPTSVLPALATAAVDSFGEFPLPSPAMSPLTVPSDEKSNDVTLSSDSVSKLTEEIQCCICLDIQVHPRTLNPCGHTFCLTCVAKLHQCPQCREAIRSHVPARMLDNLITTLVGVPKLLPDDDVEQYKTRKRKTEAKIAAVRSRLPRKRQRSDITTYASSGGAPFPTHPAFGAVPRPLFARWAGSSASAVNLNRRPSASYALNLSQSSSTGMLSGFPSTQPAAATAANSRFGNQGTSQADAICID